MGNYLEELSKRKEGLIAVPNISFGIYYYSNLADHLHRGGEHVIIYRKSSETYWHIGFND